MCGGGSGWLLASADMPDVRSETDMSVFGTYVRFCVRFEENVRFYKNCPILYKKVVYLLKIHFYCKN